jgi:hypothetical protein
MQRHPSFLAWLRYTRNGANAVYNQPLTLSHPHRAPSTLSPPSISRRRRNPSPPVPLVIPSRCASPSRFSPPPSLSLPRSRPLHPPRTRVLLRRLVNACRTRTGSTAILSTSVPNGSSAHILLADVFGIRYEDEVYALRKAAHIPSQSGRLLTLWQDNCEITVPACKP